MKVPRWQAAFALYVLLLGGAAFGERVTFNKMGEAHLKCECVANSSMCGSAVFHTLSESGAHEWFQTIKVRKGTTVDLNEVCYKKRDTTGQGMCCDPAGDRIKVIETMFRGTLLEEP